MRKKISRLQMLQVVVIVGCLAFLPLVATFSMAPSVSHQEALATGFSAAPSRLNQGNEYFSIILPRLGLFYLNGDGWANPIYPVGIPQKVTLKAYGIFYISSKSTEDQPVRAGRLIVKHLVFNMGNRKVIFHNGHGYLSKKYIFIHAVKVVWLASSNQETVKRPVWIHLWLFGHRDGENVKLNGFLLVEFPRGFASWRLTLDGKLKLIPIYRP